MRKVFITAGHNIKNGLGTGAIGIIDESKEAISLRNSIVKELSKLGIEAKTDDDKAELKDVINMVSTNCKPEDFIIDIHFNASDNKSANGSEVVVPDSFNLTESHFASKILDLICYTLCTSRRRVLTERETGRKTIGILRYPKCNNILIEVCFVTNKQDVSKYQAKSATLAKNIANLIKEQL